MIAIHSTTSALATGCAMHERCVVLARLGRKWTNYRPHDGTEQ